MHEQRKWMSKAEAMEEYGKPNLFLSSNHDSSENGLPGIRREMGGPRARSQFSVVSDLSLAGCGDRPLSLEESR